MTTTIGFIGLGIMGKPMALNLMRAGYRLVVFNRSSQSMEELANKGALPARSPSEVAKSAQTIITMLPDGPDVEAVVLGKNGIIEKVSAQTVLIDMSSISPIAAKRIADALATKGARFMDAPVSGGETGAIKGELVIMAGGSEDLFTEVKPLFNVLGKSAVLIGDVGAGQTAKLVNQILVGIHIEAMGEAFILAMKAGVDPMKVFDAIKDGLAGSRILTAKLPLVLDRNFKPGFKLRLHLKDLKNALEAAESYGLSLPVTEKVYATMQDLVEQGMGDDDHAGIVRALEQENNTEIHG